MAATASASAAVPAATERPGEPDYEEHTYTVNHLRLFVIHGRVGETRVFFPPPRADTPAALADREVGTTIAAIDRVRRRYRKYTDLEVVSQSAYLLQVVPTRSDGFRYRLVPEPDRESYSADSYEGALSVETQDGQLALAINVIRGQEPVLQVEMLMEPGGPIVLATPLRDGGAIFAVLTADAPELQAIATNAARSSVPADEVNVPVPETDPVVEEEPEPIDPHQIFLQWDIPPRLIESVKPDYPEIARRAGVEGRVTLHIVVGIDGTVEEVTVVRAQPGGIFDESARESVLKWRYKPAILDGRPVRSRFSQTLQFVFDQPGSRYR
jgi:TonB family protein